MGSASLVDAIKAQDPSAWRRLTRLYGPIVYGWACREGLRQEDAADVSQEVFQAVAESIHKFRRDRPTDSLLAWVRGITRHKLQDFFRRQSKQPEAAGGSDVLHRLAMNAPSPADSSAADDIQQLARRAMALIQTDFQESTWRAFWLTAVEGRSAADVAAELGISQASVYSAKSRILARLRQELNDSLE